MWRSPLPKIPGYYLLGVAGRGQFGRVLCAYHVAWRCLVALKELDKHRFPTHKLLRELRFLIDLNHPNIAKCFTLLYTDQHRYLVLEYCEAGTLRDLMRCSDCLTPRQRVRLVIDLLKGLEYAHNLQIVHCDIKPENVLLQLSNEGWRVKVSDFGIAHLLEESEQHLGSRTGSPAYMAPERFYGQFSCSSDLYAVGIILYELFTGNRPFTGTAEELMIAHLHQRPPDLERLPAPLQGIVQKALAKLPAQRYSSAGAMISALEQAIADLPVDSTPSFPVLTVPSSWGQRQGTISAMTSWRKEKLLLAIANQVLVMPQQDSPQPLLTTHHPIQQVEQVGDYLFVKTDQALLRYPLANPSGGVLLYQTKQPYTAAIAPCGSWFAIGRGETLEIRSLRYRKSYQLILQQREILAVQALDAHYLVCLVRKRNAPENRLVFLSRRGQVLGRVAVPYPAKQIVKSTTPYRLLVLLAEPHPALLLVDLLPYRTRRLPLPFVPQFVTATPWGYAIASNQVLMLFDLMGQSVGNLAFSQTISAVTAWQSDQLAVAEGCHLHLLNLGELGVDLIF
jgi:serine/threonine-protein kinase